MCLQPNVTNPSCCASLLKGEIGAFELVDILMTPPPVINCWDLKLKLCVVGFTLLKHFNVTVWQSYCTVETFSGFVMMA